MTRLLLSLGTVTLGLGSLAGVRLATAGNTYSPEPVPGREAAAPEAAPAARSLELRGLTVEPASAALEAQLRIPSAAAWLVTGVAQDSPAAEAGLEVFDVVVEVEGQEPSAKIFEAAASDRGHLDLEVVREGLEQSVTLPEDAASEEAFLSTDGLAADHPILRTKRLRRMRAQLDRRSEEFSQARDELAEQERAARQEAAGAVDELHREAVAGARAYLEERAEEWLTLVDQELAAERVAPLRALRLELFESLPSERVEAVYAGLTVVGKELPGRIVASAELGDERSTRALRQRLDRVGDAVAERLNARVAAPWTEVRKSLPAHAKRLGGQHDERMAWSEAALEKTRVEVRARIDCAVDRAVEEFSRKLRERLRQFDVPAPGEIEESLADLSGQLEAWTQGFVRRTGRALASYTAEVTPLRSTLGPYVGARLAAAEASSTELAQSVAGVLAALLPAGVAGDGSWRDRDQANLLVERLAADLLDAVHDERGALRPAARELVRALDDERAIADESWRDLREALSGIASAAAEDCWKLDGPHLDGRFPLDAVPPKGEVALAD